MTDDTFRNFVGSFAEDIDDALQEANEPPVNAHFRLGVRRLAKAFFDKAELFGIYELMPELAPRDIDGWYAGEPRDWDTD